MPARRPDRRRLVLALFIALTGIVWTLQGLGVDIGRSFMVGDLRWSAIGVALVAVAAWLAYREVGPLD